MALSSTAWMPGARGSDRERKLRLQVDLRSTYLPSARKHCSRLATHQQQVPAPPRGVPNIAGRKTLRKVRDWALRNAAIEKANSAD